MREIEVKITKELSGKRMDIALSILITELTRNFIKKQIEQNQVYLNGNVEYRANYKVREGDMIKIQYEAQATGLDEIKPEKIPLDIVYEDEDLIVINKPIDMVVHPSTGNWSGTVMNALVYKYAHLANVGERIRSGLIHRIDKQTSGLLLIGKTNRGLWHYSKQFASRNVLKVYIAVCEGKNLNINNNKFEISSYIARNTGERTKMMTLPLEAHNLPADARIATTMFEIIAQKDNRYLILAYPKTGRTHQIRVHTKMLGIPIIGDTMYGKVQEQRMMLHAMRIEIPSPTGDTKKFVAKPDRMFTSICTKYGFKNELAKIFSQFDQKLFASSPSQ